ncbi:hypothetical protein GCM10010254_20890 [Streptomyces chromofuscus]|nr:hypothetical protein GCM10010254_20890 [Streptomyces chromofuscus]
MTSGVARLHAPPGLLLHGSGQDGENQAAGTAGSFGRAPASVVHRLVHDRLARCLNASAMTQVAGMSTDLTVTEVADRQRAADAESHSVADREGLAPARAAMTTPIRCGGSARTTWRGTPLTAAWSGDDVSLSA